MKLRRRTRAASCGVFIKNKYIIIVRDNSFVANCFHDCRIGNMNRLSMSICVLLQSQHAEALVVLTVKNRTYISMNECIVFTVF